MLHGTGVTLDEANVGVIHYIMTERGFVMHSACTFGQMLWSVIFPLTDSFSKDI